MRNALRRWIGPDPQQVAEIQQLKAQVAALQHQMLTLRAGLNPAQWSKEFDRMPLRVALVAVPDPESGWPTTLPSRQH